VIITLSSLLKCPAVASFVYARMYVQHGETALHFAASGGHLDVIQLLRDKGMNVNARDQVR